MKKLIAILAIVACSASLIAASKPSTLKGPAALGTGSISGVVTDSATGNPIAGAAVSAGCRRQASATTASDGSYTIEGLEAGTYSVKAMKCGAYVMKTYPTPVVVAEGQHVEHIDFALAPMGGGRGNGSISGTVYDAGTNQPLAGAKVMAGRRGACATTGSDGTYIITGLADGSYTVSAMKPGYQSETYPSPVVIQNGNPVTGIDFHLQSVSRLAPRGPTRS